MLPNLKVRREFQDRCAKSFLLLVAGVLTAGAGAYFLFAGDSGFALPVVLAGIAIAAWATYLRRCPGCGIMVTEYAPRQCPGCETDLTPVPVSHPDRVDVPALYRRNRRLAIGLMVAAIVILASESFLAFGSSEAELSTLLLPAIISIMLGIGSVFAYRCPACRQILMRPGSGKRIEQMRLQRFKPVPSCPFCGIGY
ncbi:MAG: acetone carboxylase subunit gamma [Acidobacteria bacterium]|nr:acetone carboxylase subunit gamma [Acidobacteriota bacterium]